MADDRNIGRNKHGAPQERNVGRGRWTKARKKIFIEMLAATCNVRRSCDAAGMSYASVYALRIRDSEFATEWDMALAAGHSRLEAMLILRATGAGAEPPDGSVPVPDPANMDPELALHLLRHHQSRLLGRPRRGGPAPRRATPAETDASILRKLSALNRRLGGQG